jgi:hypothetical protein
MDAKQRLLSGAAWEDFCDQLKQAGRIVSRFGDDINELDRAEWYRFMARLTRNGLERFLENCEPDRPRLRDVPWRQSINFQSPDQDHLLTEFVDGSHDYIISGNRGTLPYFVIASWNSTQPPNPGDRDWANQGIASLQTFDPTAYQTTGFITSDQVHFDGCGNFKIAVSRQPIDGIQDWLPIQPQCVGLLVRTLYHDRAGTTAPEFAIARIDQPSPRAILAAEVADGLAKAAQTVLGYGELVRRWWQDNLAQRPNRIRFDRTVYLSNGGVPDRHHGFGTWQCEAHEALVIDFMPSPCSYWIFQLCSIWQENLDNYEDGQGFITKYTCRFRSDGSVRVVIASEDPGIDGNYLCPFEHVHGGMSLRFIGLMAGSEPPPISLRRVSLTQLKSRGEAALEHVETTTSGEVAE